MKKIIIFLFLLTLLFATGCSYTKPQPISYKSENSSIAYVKSIWITYYELEEMLNNKDKTDFYSDFSNKIDYLINSGFNTITVQVRPFADSFYNSKYFPKSKYNPTDFDVLSVICDVCNSKNVNVEAWLNPYRVSLDNDIDNLSKDSPAYKWKNTSNLIVIDNGIYFNPASNKVTKLISNGVKEIVDNYNISAIHFDDYFYPSKEKNIDKTDYELYLDNGGTLSLYDWRRNNVTNMIKSVSAVIKQSNKNIKFGISPAANIKTNQNDLFADVKLWCKNNDFIDYICPQVYFGFKNETMPFMSTVKQWQELSNIKTYIGLPLYKYNTIDEYAGRGSKEFINNKDIINRQIEYISKIDKINGIYVFSYSSFIQYNDAISKLKEI